MHTEWSGRTIRLGRPGMGAAWGVLVPLALALSTSPASAQWSRSRGYPSQGYPSQGYPSQDGQQTVLDWSGRVDKEVRIEMQGGRAWVDLVGNKETSTGRLRTYGGLPQGTATISVAMLSGRGRVDVLQQPNPYDNYTAVIRVRDPQSGQDNYHIRVYTNYAGNGTYGNGPYDNGRNGNGNGTYDDGRGNGRQGRGHAYGHRHRDRHDDDDGDRD